MVPYHIRYLLYCYINTHIRIAQYPYQIENCRIAICHIVSDTIPIHIYMQHSFYVNLFLNYVLIPLDFLLGCPPFSHLIKCYF